MAKPRNPGGQGKPASAVGGNASHARGSKAWGRAALVVFAVPLAAFLLPTTVVLAVVMLPTMAAYIVDRTPNKAFTIAVGLLNSTGSLPAVFSLWGQGHTLGVALRVLGDPIMWMGPYLAAGFGWMIFLMLPALIRRYYEVASQARLSTLRKRQAELRDIWGNEVAGDAEADRGDAGQA